MKLEKFDLEKIIHGSKVVTRDGIEVLKLTNFGLDDYPLVGVLNNEINSWTIDGYYQDENEESEKDLFLAVEPKRVYANVMQYANGDLWVGSECFSTFETARNFAIKNQKTQLFKRGYVKTIEITDEL
jgi:hypothetical protein